MFAAPLAATAQPGAHQGQWLQCQRSWAPAELKASLRPGGFSAVKAFAGEAEQRAVPIQHCSPAEILPHTQVILQLFVSLMKWSCFLLPDVPTAKCLENAFLGD